MTEIDQAFVDRIMPRRDPEANKNAFGRILCVCGSAGYTGAAYFAAQGAVRMGSGVVTLAVPEKAWPVLAVKLNEPVVRPLPCGADGMFSLEALPALLACVRWEDPACRDEVYGLLARWPRVPAVLVGLLFHALLGGAARRSLWPTVALLAVMCLPFLVSRLDAALRAVPEKYERAGTALGGSRMAVLWMVLLPQALPGIVRALLRLAEKVLCEATAVLALLCAVTPDSLLAPELFRLTWLGREDASVLAFALAAGMIALRLAAERRWRSEGEEANCRYNWW